MGFLGFSRVSYRFARVSDRFFRFSTFSRIFQVASGFLGFLRVFECF